MIKQRGFTLIELLVVIAIIGILAGIVLASLGNARSKAGDAKTKEQLSSFRGAMEVYYATNGNYGPTVALGSTADGCSSAVPSVLPWSDSASGLLKLADERNYSLPTSGTIVCLSTGSAWAVQAQMSSGYFCVDSNGTATSTSGTTIAATTDITC